MTKHAERLDRVVNFLGDVFQRALTQRRLEESDRALQQKLVQAQEGETIPDDKPPQRAMEKAFQGKILLPISRHLETERTDSKYLPQALAILTDTGHLFGASVDNVRTNKNPDGENLPKKALDNLDANPFLLSGTFGLSAVMMTGTRKDLCDWGVLYPKERDRLIHSGIQTIIYWCPDTGEQVELAL